MLWKKIGIRTIYVDKKVFHRKFLVTFYIDSGSNLTQNQILALKPTRNLNLALTQTLMLNLEKGENAWIIFSYFHLTFLELKIMLRDFGIAWPTQDTFLDFCSSVKRKQQLAVKLWQITHRKFLRIVCGCGRLELKHFGTPSQANMEIRKKVKIFETILGTMEQSKKKTCKKRTN